MAARNMKITGLPTVGKVKLDRPPAQTGKSSRRALGGKLGLRFDNGWLTGVTNPRGTKAPVYIAQTSHPGFTVRYDRAPFTLLGYGYRNAEKLAVRLALRGHKRVAIRG